MTPAIQDAPTVSGAAAGEGLSRPDPAASTPCQEALWRVLCRFSEVAQENYDTGVENRILERERDYLLLRLSELGVEP